MYSEVYLHKSCRGMAACIKTALWLLARPSPSRNNAWMSGQEFVEAALKKTDSEFLIWMSHELRAKGGVEAEAAKLLIDKVFLTGERALYKRVRTLCALFPKHDYRNLKNLREDIDKMSFIQRNAAERRLEGLVGAKLKRNIPAYSLLLDVVHTHATDLPQLVRIAGGQAEKLTDVSPTIRALSGDDHQPRHTKVRLFASPGVATLIREGLTDDHIDDLLRKAIK